jgi:hypothetical protein
MSDCCKSKLEELLQRMSDKIGPLVDTADPNTAMTEEQFGMFKVMMWVSGEAEKMIGPLPGEGGE